MESVRSRLPEILKKHQQELLEDWIAEQNTVLSRRMELISDYELRAESTEFMNVLQRALQQQTGNADIDDPAWDRMRDFLGRLSYARAQKGFNPTETAIFVFSFKQPLFGRLRSELSDNPVAIAEETWDASVLLDKLGLYTTEVYQESRNKIIERQQQEIMELSTPVVRLWHGILALPMIGTLDSQRTQVVMENLLKALVDTGSAIAIIDITGVPTVDTLVAQHLLKTIAAARLMGADCFISGIRPQIAQTIVHLGVSLPDVVTKATLADAFGLALRRLGLKVVKNETAASSSS